MQLTLFFLRLTEEFRSPLALAEVQQRMQQATAPSITLGWPAFHEPAPLFQGWVRPSSFRLSQLPESRRRRHQKVVVIEGEVTAGDASGSQLRLLYRPMLAHLLTLGFWLLFSGTLVLVSILSWLRNQPEYFSWGPVGLVCAVYGLFALSFWWEMRRSRRLLITLLSLERIRLPHAS